jgi:hypothetical protein
LFGPIVVLSFPTRRSCERESIFTHADIPWIPAHLLAQASGMTGSAMVDATLRGNGKFHRTNQYLI